MLETTFGVVFGISEMNFDERIISGREFAGADLQFALKLFALMADQKDDEYRENDQ